MADRQVSFEITATDRSAGAVAAAARGLDRLGDQADGATRDLGQLERETGRLRNQMLQTAAAAKVLGREFANTGDTKILKEFEKMTREAGRLDRALKAIEPPRLDFGPVGTRRDTVFRALFGGITDAAQQAGKLAGKTVINTFGEAFRAVPSEVKLGMIGAVAGAAVAAAPFIAAAIQGAVLAGVAGGGIAAGLILAASDPKVRTAYQNLGNEILRDLQMAAAPFAVELRRVAPELGSAFNQQLPRLRAMFATLSEAVTPLVRGVIGFAEKIAPGLERAARAGKDIVAGLAGRLPALGDAVGHLLSAFASGGPAASRALQSLVEDLTLLIHVLALGAQTVSPLLNALAKFDELVNPLAAFNREGKETARWVEPAAANANRAAQDWSLLGQSLTNTANAADALNASFERLFGEAMNLDQANLKVKQGMLSLKETIKENGKTLSENTEKGLANREAILSQIQALDAKRQAEIAAGNGTKAATEKANAAYASNVAALRGVLISLGLSAAAVDALIGKYQALAAIPDIVVRVTTQYRTDGTVSKPGAGNSQGAKLSAMNTWAPYRFASGGVGSPQPGTHRTGGPVEVHSESTVYVDLDGEPFRQMTARTVSAAERRTAWRTKVGTR